MDELKLSEKDDKPSHSSVQAALGPQLPAEIWEVIAVHLRCLPGSGAIDGHPGFDPTSRPPPHHDVWGNVTLNRRSQIWSFLSHQLEHRTRTQLEDTLGEIEAATYNRPKSRKEARTRVRLLRARGRDLVALSSTSKAIRTAVTPVIDVVKDQLVYLGFDLPDPTIYTRVEKATPWLSFTFFVISWVGQGPVAVAAVAALRSQPISARVYGAFALAFFLMPLLTSAPVCAIGYAREYEIELFPWSELAGWLLFLVWSICTIVISTIIGAAAFSFDPALGGAAAASALLISTGWWCSMAFSTVHAPDRSTQTSLDACDRCMSVVFLAIHVGFWIASAALFARVSQALGASFVVTPADRVGIELCSTSQAAAAGAAAAAAYCLSALSLGALLGSRAVRSLLRIALTHAARGRGLIVLYMMVWKGCCTMSSRLRLSSQRVSLLFHFLAQP